MSNIESYIFFDIETTGLPWQERNQTKITELSFVAVLRKDLLKTKHGDSPPVSKLTLVFNPRRPIHPEAVALNGLSNELLKHAPLFSQKLETIVSFIQELPKPVCLVAHNGNNFDFKILLAECNDANFSLPKELLCVDSIVGFRNFHSNQITPGVIEMKNKLLNSKPNIDLVENFVQNEGPNEDDLLTDDEDEWPNINVSTEEWEDIDKLCDSLSDISCEDVTEKKENSKQNGQGKTVSRSKVIHDVFKKGAKKANESFTLLALYRRLTNREPDNHHRAEEDCLMLLQCVVATKELFIPWADKACKKLTDIKPLIRY